ncbi:hypothetical protein FJQ55_03930 [Rhizobium glycinendophyticum]|uniref:Propionyl-coenzyme A carboxylase alpha polypeptide n=1 Tax=Rhizobium glycinendophyticum TaxID=2589807 RepID=A0A504UTE9_9HYPH|nr:hypothetical protein FJQ55_03930 [Rhizobium glycinendophyticum]
MIPICFFSAAHPPLSCRTSPPQGGRSVVAAARSSASVAKTAFEVIRSSIHLDDQLPTFAEGRSTCGFPISPLEGEMPGRAEGGELVQRDEGAVPC